MGITRRVKETPHYCGPLPEVNTKFLSCFSFFPQRERSLDSRLYAPPQESTVGCGLGWLSALSGSAGFDGIIKPLHPTEVPLLVKKGVKCGVLAVASKH